MLMRATTAGIDCIEPRPDRDYFVMLAEPNREMTAQANLILRRVPFYLPTIFRPARISARAQAKGAPHPDIPMALFPGMIFIEANIVGCMLGAIRSAYGMRSQPFMKFGDQFALIRSVGMQAIQMIESAEREKYFARKRKNGAPAWMPKIGQEVRVLLDEVLGGTEGTVSGLDAKGRIVILTEIMKRTVRVHVTANQIEPV